MSLVVGITGGIGSGKTTISQFFNDLGIPVYNADDEAKKLMLSPRIKKQLIQLLGSESFTEKGLNRDFVREQIFKDEGLRQKINDIVHPEVGRHFRDWLKRQDAPYVLKEAAIIFEEGLSDQYDCIITVYADEELRVQRLLKRSGLTRQMIQNIMEKQWSDEKKIAFSDYSILNNDLKKARQKTVEIHHKLLERSQNL
jgi:dephospho-CoA kinase